MFKRLVYYLLGPLAFILGAILIYLAVNLVTALIGWEPPLISDSGKIVFALLVSAVPLLSGFLFARAMVSLYSRKAHVVKPFLFKRRWVFLFLIGAYLLTWAVGGPAVQNVHSRWAIEEYARIRKGKAQGSWEGTPFVWTYVTYPILPFILISYHEYQIAPVYGWGGFDIDLWYLNGVKRIFSIPVWIS